MMAEFQEVCKQWERMCSIISCGKCAINDCCDSQAPTEAKIVEETVMAWAAEHPEPQYPTWGEWLYAQEVLSGSACYWEGKYMYSVNHDKFNAPIPADIAEKLGIEPKEG